MAKKKNALPYDKAGGRIVIQRRLLESDSYLSLSLYARCLIPLLQCQWRNNKLVDFGIREAARKLSCGQRTAMAAFNSLRAAGFIETDGDYFLDTFGTSGGSRPRAWRLTWLPFQGKPPTNDWETQRAAAPRAAQN